MNKVEEEAGRKNAREETLIFFKQKQNKMVTLKLEGI